VLTGGSGADTFLFRFQQSLLANPDRITDFAIGVDKIDLLSASGAALPAPTSFTRASNGTATTLAAVVSAVYTDANGGATGKQPLALNSAALVVATASAIAGTYLVINNAVAGFQPGNDLVVNITGHTGSLPAAGVVPASQWFA
jgi:Ca2+-binding RTX toxin-like protein